MLSTCLHSRPRLMHYIVEDHWYIRGCCSTFYVGMAQVVSFTLYIGSYWSEILKMADVSKEGYVQLMRGGDCLQLATAEAIDRRSYHWILCQTYQLH